MNLNKESPKGTLSRVELLDYFAAKAMQSLLITTTKDEDLKILAWGAYQWANAMLKEREKWI